MSIPRFLGSLVIVGTVSLVGWWVLDPVGFANSALIRYLQNIGGRAGSHFTVRG